jgi:hypothetical protein
MHIYGSRVAGRLAILWLAQVAVGKISHRPAGLSPLTLLPYADD